MANSLIFILIGILMVNPILFDWSIAVVILMTVVIVALARALSIYPVVSIYNRFRSESQRIPGSWQHVLAWGSLRGALAVTMVFLVPTDLHIPDWNFPLSPPDFLLALTVGCIAATLFIKAPTINPLMRRLRLDALTAIEEVEYQEARALMHHEVATQLARYVERGYIDTTIATQLMNEHRAACTHACETIQNLPKEAEHNLTVRVLRLYAIGIEKRWLKELYHHNEVNETVYRYLYGKLQLQHEAIEHGNLSPDTSLHTDGRDIFEKIVGLLHPFRHPSKLATVTDRYMYYRAQAIISRKVLKEIGTLNEQSAASIFTTEAVKHVTDLYTMFKEGSEAKLTKLVEEHPETTRALSCTLAEHSVHTIEERVLHDVLSKELITPKLYITLTNEISVVQPKN
jgi:CPA1 family monovalent cation:H+ antiporter